MKAGYVAGLWALAFCGWAAADDAALDSVEGRLLGECVERAVVHFRYDFDRVEQTLTAQATAFIRTRCGDEIAAYRAKLAPTEVGDPATSIVSPAYDERIELMFHNLASAALSEHIEPVRPKRGEEIVRKNGRFVGFASANALSGDEVLIIQRQDAFKYGSEALWVGPLAGARYAYWSRGDQRWGARVDESTKDLATVMCGYDDHAGKCVVTLYRAIGLPTPILNVEGRGSPFRATQICSPVHPNSLFVGGVPPVQDLQGSSLTLDDGERVALGDECIADPEQKHFQRILASESVKVTYSVPGRKTPIVVEGLTAIMAASLPLAGHLSLLAADPAATERARSNAIEAERTVAPFSLRDALSFTPEWHGALGCLVQGRRAVQIRTNRKREGACANWIESLKWRAALVELNFPALPPEGTDLDAERKARRKQSEALIRAEAAAMLGSGTVPQRAARFADGEKVASVTERPGWRGFAWGSGGAVGYGYAIGNGNAVAIVPGNFGRDADNTTVLCAARGACIVRLPVGGFGTLVVTTDGSIHGSSVCFDVEAGREREGWTVVGMGGRYPVRDGCVAGDAGPALEGIASLYGGTLSHRSEPSVHWQVDGTRAEIAMALAAYFSDRLESAE